MFKTIKSKFIALSVIVIILSIGIPVGFLLNQLSENFKDRSEIMVESAIDLMIYGLNSSMMMGDQKNVQNIVEQISKNKTIEHLRIFNKLGIIKYSTQKDEIGKNIEIIEPGHIEEQIYDITERKIFLDKKTNVYKAIEPILVETRCQSCHQEEKIISYLDVDTDLTKAEINFYTGSFHMIFLGLLLIFLLALSFYLIFNKMINNPLNKFTLALEEVERGNLNLKLPADGKDEFSVLNYHYNRMTNELKNSREQIDEMHFDQLQRADKMVTLGELTASMAHDINNHSAIIMSRADFLLYEAENNKELSACIEDLNVVNDQIEKISKITGNILKHSKKLSQSFSEIDLVKLVENSCYMVEPLIKKRKVKLIKEIKLSSAQINGDPNQIEQMILNLVSNALDALPNGGELKIILQLTEENKIQLLVKDNGIGIDADSLEKIFSPFYTNKEADKGTGLGLYIVQNICKNHNAEVKCESKLNEGTTFIITFGKGNND
ncbi:MAG: HAMP domain-containing histidine kinase [Ignavibacteriales bacterium]|nr:HAMP domain-containing histidine kinase [Ignavibacteriales bacterium]